MENRKKTRSGFVPPNKARREAALGKPEQSCTAMAKALSDIEKYW